MATAQFKIESHILTLFGVEGSKIYSSHPIPRLDEKADCME